MRLPLMSPAMLCLAVFLSQSPAAWARLDPGLRQDTPTRLQDAPSPQHDSLQGLADYGYRYYDPIMGRWPSRDPIGELGGVNMYGMLRNRLLSNIDRFGLCLCGEKKDCRLQGYEFVTDATANMRDKLIADIKNLSDFGDATDLLDLFGIVGAAGAGATELIENLAEFAGGEATESTANAVAQSIADVILRYAYELDRTGFEPRWLHITVEWQECVDYSWTTKTKSDQFGQDDGNGGAKPFIGFLSQSDIGIVDPAKTELCKEAGVK